MLKTLLALVVIAIAAAVGYAFWYVGTPVPIARYPVEVEIPRGAGFRAAMEQLEKSGVGVRRHEFELLARTSGKVRNVKAGSYEIATAGDAGRSCSKSSRAATSPRPRCG